MPEPLDLDAINEELAGAGCLRPRTAAKVLAEIVRLRAALSLNVGLVGKLSFALDESVPRSSLVQVGWRHPEGYVCAEERWSWCRTRSCADQPVYVIREDTDA